MIKDIFNEEGLSFLKKEENNSIDLVLTDPPYITSRDTGMHKWTDHVEKQDQKGSKNIKTEKDWETYKTDEEWDEWFANGDISRKKRKNKLKELKAN